MNNLNSLALAYIGDAIYEVEIREFLLKRGIIKVNDLQKEAIKFVSAKRQAYLLKELLERNFFKEDEIDIINRARNHKGNRHPKNTDIITYKHATAFEAIIGYWHFNNFTRFKEMMKMIYEEICNY